MKTKKKTSVWKDFIAFVRTVKLPYVLIAASFLLNLGKAVLELLIPGKMAAVTGIDLSGGDASVTKTAVALCLTVFAMALTDFVIGLAAVHITHIAKAQISRDFQKTASRKIFSLKIRDIEARDPREFISRITTDTGFISDFLIDLLVNEVPRLYYVVSAIWKVTRMGSGSLALAFILVIPVIILGSFWSGRVTFRTQNRLQSILAAFTAKIAEKVGNIETIKAYNMTEEEIGRGEKDIDEMKAAQKKVTWAAALNTLVSNILFIVPTLIIAVCGAVLLLNRSITVTQFVEYYAIGVNYQTYIAAHLTLWVLAKQAQGATLRLSEVMEMEGEPGGTEAPVSGGDIEFRNVSFSYGDRQTLNDVSFRIASGSKAAIVGQSGSGKTTVLNLIEQFYRPEKGTISLGGTDITQFETRRYRDLFSYLPQNAPGFSGTVRDMLTYGTDRQISDEECRGMLAKVGMLEAVEALGGLDYEVGPDAGRLSGGQRQRLAVARMLLSEAGIVLADEATSALDAEGARTVSRLIDEAAAGKTRVIVAHHLSTVTDADQIIVMEHGKVADAGTHEELLRRCGLYRSLLNTEEVTAS